MRIQILLTVSHIILSLAPIVGAGTTKKSCDASNEYVFGCECLEFVITPQVTWQRARSVCSSKGGRLVTIQDSDKQGFVADKLNKICDKNGVWIGLSRITDKDTFRWTDGKHIDDGYKNWAPDEPDDYVIAQRCVNMYKSENWGWKDAYCTWPYSYVCQYDLSCGSAQEQGLPPNTVIGIVIGGVAGVICFFALIFMIINCCRKDEQYRRPVMELQQVETGEMDDMCLFEPTISPPSENKTLSQSLSNDLGEPTTVVKEGEGAALSHSRPPRYAFTPRDRKISNLSVEEQQSRTDNNRNEEIDAQRSSVSSLEDNVMAANTDSGENKEYTSNKL